MRGDLYFERSNGEQVLLKLNCNKNEAWRAMFDFMSRHNYKCYYVRSRYVERTEEVLYDVGSHTEFFIWKCKGVKWLHEIYTKWM